MEGSNGYVLSQASSWLQQGSPVWLATVTATYGSSPRPVGSLWAWSPDFGMAGSLSGGCVEEDLIERLRSGALQGAFPQRLRFGASEEEQSRYRLPCGGHLDIILERLGRAESRHLQLMLHWLGQRQPFVRDISLDPAVVRLQQFSTEMPSPLPADSFRQTFRPQWQLLLVGAGEVARQLAMLAQPAGFAVTLCDHREDYLQGFDLPGCDVVQTMPDQLIQARFNDRHSAVVALAHDPRLDDIATLEALETDAYYIGAMGALLTSAKRRNRLQELGISDAQLQRLHAPVGLDIGSKTPFEIALSIVAHLLAERRVV